MPSSSSSPRCTIPLWLVFTLQSIVVGGAFIAVILVLSLQHESQYEDAVFEKIHLQLSVSNLSLTGPIVSRERVHRQLARRLELDPSLWFNVGDNHSSLRVQRYLNLSFFVMFEDPLAYTVYLHRLDPSNPLPDDSTNGPLRYGILAISSEFLAGVSNFDGTITVAPNPTFPLQFAATITVPQEISTASFSRSVRHSLYPQWLGPGIFENPVSGIAQVVSALAHPLEINTTLNVASLSIAYTMDVRYLVELAQQAILTPSTKGLLVSRMEDDIIASMNAGAPLYDPTTVIPWTLSNFPNQDLVARFRSTNALCTVSGNCVQYAAQEGDDILSLLYMTTEYGYKMHLFQITPRDFYFAAGRRATITGIVIGVVAAVVVLVSCVVIWFAVRGPIYRLRESMELAAVMRNDEVDDTSSVLTELDLLSQSFLQMNGKLLQARAFMPQSMLYGEDVEAEFEENVNEVIFDEGKIDVESVSSNGSRLLVSPRLSNGSSHLNLLNPARAFRTLSNRSQRSDTSVNTATNNNNVIPHFNEDASQHTTNKGTSPTSSNVSSSMVGGGIKTSESRIAGRPSRAMLQLRKVSVLMINSRGTHSLATHGGAAKLEREQVRLVELVERCARVEKGVVDAFQGDHFVLTFNAVRPVGTPARNGAVVALSIQEGAQRDELALGRFSMGLSVGRSYIGNVGSATMKKNCTVGSVYTNAVGLERLAKRVGRTCVVNGQAHSEIEVAAYCLALGTVRLSNEESDSLWAVMQSMGNNAGGGDEWLYEMAESTKNNPYQSYNRAIDMLQKGRAEEALAALEELVISSSPRGGEGQCGAGVWDVAQMLVVNLQECIKANADTSYLYSFDSS